VADVERHAGLLSLLQKPGRITAGIWPRGRKSSDPVVRPPLRVLPERSLRGRMVLLRPAIICVEGANCVLSGMRAPRPDDDRGEHGGKTCHSDERRAG